ncbi:DUF3159 domain-containing protein [Nakamurella sp. GG22]
MTPERRPGSAGDTPDLTSTYPTGATTDGAAMPPGPGRDSGIARFLPDDLADRAAAEISQGDSVPGSPPDPDGRPADDRLTGDPRADDRLVDDPQSDTAKADTAKAPPTIWEQMGGPMGMVDSGLPVVVFIIGNAIGGLGWGIGAALAAAVLIAGLRIARRRPVTQAIAGVFGVGIAAYIAYRTDSAKGYFLLGIWSYLLYGGALLLSMVVRWPLIGLIWEGINGRGTAWRSDRRLVRRYDWATLVWVVVFAARYLVQNYLYDSDQVGWLAAVRLLMGYPLFIVAIAISVWIVAGARAIPLPDKLTRRR